MIATIIIVGLALAWLGHESNWLTIRLPYGANSVPCLNATYETLMIAAPAPVLLLPAPKRPKLERMTCYKHKAVKA